MREGWKLEKINSVLRGKQLSIPIPWEHQEKKKNDDNYIYGGLDRNHQGADFQKDQIFSRILQTEYLMNFPGSEVVELLKTQTHCGKKEILFSLQTKYILLDTEDFQSPAQEK